MNRAITMWLFSLLGTALCHPSPDCTHGTGGGNGVSYCWTRWLNRDRPSGSGDWELLVDFPQHQVCPRPIGIECQTVDGRPYNATGETFMPNCEPRIGLACQNNQQEDNYCQDYRVRFLCPAGSVIDVAGQTECQNYCFTDWLDRDNPSGYCDCEPISLFQPYQTCPNPVGIECREKQTRRDFQDVGQSMQCNTHYGGVCWNAQNPGQPCKDYEVRFLCSCGSEIE